MIKLSVNQNNLKSPAEKDALLRVTSGLNDDDKCFACGKKPIAGRARYCGDDVPLCPICYPVAQANTLQLIESGVPEQYL